MLGQHLSHSCWKPSGIYRSILHWISGIFPLFPMLTWQWSALWDWEATLTCTEVHTSIMQRLALSQGFIIFAADTNSRSQSSSPCLAGNKEVLLPTYPVLLNSPFFQPRSRWEGLLICICGCTAVRQGRDLSFQNNIRSPIFKNHLAEFKTRHKLASEHLWNNTETVSQVPSCSKILRYLMLTAKFYHIK